MTYRARINVAKTRQGKLEPIDIYGNWVVTAGTTGIDSQTPSTFRITSKDGKHVLKKKKGVHWMGIGPGPIELHAKRAQIYRNNNIVLVGTIRIRQTKYELALGSDDSGNTLKIEVKLAGQAPIVGGSGSAGRGG